MSVLFQRLAVGIVAVLGMVGLVNSADDDLSRLPSSEAAAALAAPEFAKDLDVDAAVTAFRANDADGLLGIGEKLGKAEQILGKTNAPLPAAAFYRMAIRIRRDDHDLKQLDRLETVIGAASHLSQSVRDQLLTEVNLARKFSAGARKIDAGPGLKPAETTPEAIALYHTFAKEIRITEEYGTEEELAQLLDGIKQLRELHPKQRDHLGKMASTARVAIRDRDKADPAIIMLASASRSVTSGLRILGPAEVAPGGTVQLIVLATSPDGKKPGQLHFRSSAGVDVPKAVAWTGTPLVIPVSIKVGTKSRVLVSAGLNSGANSMSWNAQIARE